MITEYDELIKKATDRHLPGTDWRLLKAQLQAESSLNPDATSPAGAMGIAQFMPDTWEDVKTELQLPDNASAYNTIFAIQAAAYTLQKMNHIWTTQRPDADRYCLALASYNAGAGNLIKAQKQADMAVDYYTIAGQLHNVTGEKNAKQTKEYVKRIFNTFIDYLISGR